ncbi:MAG: 30S ribosome-binding factor RbfA [Candidatus Lightella neohaematopini]|nr:30S ribosome-binding factor RbfA [Candidatus Lightella neohaematopini]MCV2531026.1 30S ribosome-binding factor RbfA [Candidatus Lightella neohaematopini]
MFVQKNYRIQRIAKILYKEITKIILYKLNNPNIGIITISKVLISNDLHYVKVFITSLNKNNINQINFSIKPLTQATNYIKYHINKHVLLKKVRHIIFLSDNTLLKSIKVINLINNIKY